MFGFNWQWFEAWQTLERAICCVVFGFAGSRSRAEADVIQRARDVF